MLSELAWGWVFRRPGSRTDCPLWTCHHFKRKWTDQKPINNAKAASVSEWEAGPPEGLEPWDWGIAPRPANAAGAEGASLIPSWAGAVPLVGLEVESHPATSPHGMPSSPSGTILGKSSSFWDRHIWHQGKTTVAWSLTPSAGSPSSPCAHLLALAGCSYPAPTGSLLQHEEGLSGWVNILLTYICSSLKGHGWQEKRLIY